jgi:hypothetical protein
MILLLSDRRERGTIGAFRSKAHFSTGIESKKVLRFERMESRGQTLWRVRAESEVFVEYFGNRPYNK